MTRVSFRRSGGFAGRQIEADIDLDEMPAEESRELERLIHETQFFKIPQNLIEPAAPDEYEYTVTVEANGPSNATNVQLTDTTPPELSFVPSPPGAGEMQSQPGGEVTETKDSSGGVVSLS